MGLYKLCEHAGRSRDRCDHPWWGSFRGVRVSLAKWTNREVRSKTEAAAALDELRQAVRAGTFTPQSAATTRPAPITFREFAEIYRTRHVIPKRLALAADYDWSIRPFLDRFGDRALTEIRTADVQDFDRRPPEPRASSGAGRGCACCRPATVNRIVDLLRHMLNWAVGPRVLSSGRRSSAAARR